jgi:carbon storage regulator
MLILSRRHGQGIRIGDAISVTVLAVDGQVVRLGIDAPASCKILRDELWNLVAGANQEAITAGSIAGDLARMMESPASSAASLEAGRPA